jgi:hypothetical protein
MMCDADRHEVRRRSHCVVVVVLLLLGSDQINLFVDN